MVSSCRGSRVCKNGYQESFRKVEKKQFRESLRNAQRVEEADEEVGVLASGGRVSKRGSRAE